MGDPTDITIVFGAFSCSCLGHTQMILWAIVDPSDHSVDFWMTRQHSKNPPETYKNPPETWQNMVKHGKTPTQTVYKPFETLLKLMIWTKTSVSNTGPLVFPAPPPKKIPSTSTPSSLGWALVSWNARSRSSAWRPDGEIWSRVAVFGGDQNGKQLCQPELGANKAPCVFFLPIYTLHQD